MGFCKNCIYWKLSYSDFGLCEETIVNFKVKADPQKKQDEEVVHTEGTFGCIYFREKELVVTRLPKVDL